AYPEVHDFEDAPVEKPAEKYDIEPAADRAAPEDRVEGSTLEETYERVPTQEYAAALASGEESLSVDNDFARQLAHLRASIDQIFTTGESKVLMFAGSVPGEGASMTAASFAQMLADDPRLRVAYIDADFRNEDLRPVDTVEPGTGLASVLVRRAAASDSIHTSNRLDILPSEGIHKDPYQICSEEHLAPLLRYLRSQYHFTIIDAAPVLNAPETSVLAGMVDGVVMVVHAGRTKREIVKRSVERMGKYSARVLGVVMNRQQYVIPEFIYRRL
ncbi:MAG: CpsD/CapB family tyrosine-protein kinase, partial [Candidatus Eisenbacteria bacterium]|nr:CpsD/CapB family tyrosine-protein kinase [Candidatus Eisenbacteria bacterium]